MTCGDVRERLSDHALGLLEPDELKEVDAHLAWCTGCRKESAELAEGVASVGLSIPQAEPPSHLEDRVVERVRSVAGTKRRIAQRRGVRVLAIAALAAAITAGSALQWGIAQRNQAESLKGRVARIDAQNRDLVELIKFVQKQARATGTLYEARLYPGPAHEEAGVALIFDAKGASFMLVQVDVPLNERDQPYTVNLIGSGRTLPAGTLMPTANGYELPLLSLPHDLSHPDALELSQVTTIQIVDARGVPVLTGTVHQHIDTPPTP